MFSVIKSSKLDMSAKSIQDMLGETCDRTLPQIQEDLETTAKLIRNNIARGLHWHTTLLYSEYDEQDAKYFAALYAEMFWQELIYTRNAIQFIVYIASRYHEEEVIDKRDQEDEDYDYIETLPMTKQDIPQKSTKFADDLFIGCNLINRRYIEFLTKFGPSLTLLSISNDALQLSNKKAIFDRFSRSIVSACSDKPSPTHGQFIGDLTELFQICQQTERMMSVFAFSNLFRYIEGSSYIKNPISSDDSIFANQGRPLKFEDDKPPVPMFKLDI
jgi:hypothetical protein